MAELQVAIVAVDRSVWTGTAKNVVLKTVEGDMGILPGHEPVLAMLSDGPVRVDPVDDDPKLFAVHGGFFSLNGNRIQILTELVEAAEDIDIARAKASKERIGTPSQDDGEQVAALERAETRIAVATRQQDL
jgi:F-type H+-transporting ATPase subunit epsilon